MGSVLTSKFSPAHRPIGSFAETPLYAIGFEPMQTRENSKVKISACKRRALHRSTLAIEAFAQAMAFHKHNRIAFT
jgi:hypothetical protein